MKKRYEELDSLRGVAALLVVLFHYTMHKEEAALGFKLGTTGVDLFFMISGFVILFSLENVWHYKQFIINRISRLYPTYWACVSLTFLSIIGGALYKNSSHIDVLQYLGNLSMFQFYLGISDIDGSYWTMIIEMLFYMVMLLLFHFRLLKYLNTIFLTTTLLTVIAMNYTVENSWIRKIYDNFPLLQYLPMFHIGTIFYRIITTNRFPLKSYGLIVICLLCQTGLFHFSQHSKDFINVSEYALMLSAYTSLFLLLVHQKLNFIVNRVTLFLGKISFALYLIHQKISLRYLIPTIEAKLHLNFWSTSLLALGISIGLATGITYFVEIPLSKKMKNWLYTMFAPTGAKAIILQ